MVVLSHMLDNPKDFDDITLITILTLVRKDRLPYLMKRWKHRINMVIFATENEIDELREVIDSYKSYKRITFILYIVKSRTNSRYQSIYYDGKKPVYRNNTIFPINVLRDLAIEFIFPINVLRDLAIEFIDTTHYFVSDIDVYSSDTLYSTLQIHNQTLKDPKAVLLLKSFLMNEKEVDHKNCYEKGLCENMYAIWIDGCNE